MEEVQQKQVETLEGIFHPRGTLRMCGENSLLWGNPDCMYWGHLKQGIQESGASPTLFKNETVFPCVFGLQKMLEVRALGLRSVLQT